MTRTPRRRKHSPADRRVILLGLAALVVVGGGSAQALQTPARPAANPSAHVWIDTDGGACARSARPTGYVDGRACGTLQAAADAARSGDTILIRSGRYPGQLLTGVKRLTFRGVGSARPSFGQLISSAANVTMARIAFENRDAPSSSVCSYFDYTLFVCGANQTYEGVVVDGLAKGSGHPDRRGGLQVDASATGLVFRNGEIRRVSDSKGFQGGADGMLIENNLWRDIRLTPAGEAAGVHNECAYVTGGNRQTWRRNRFLHCPVMAMFFANYIGGPPFTHVTVENNLFTHTLNSSGEWHDGSAFVIPNGASGQNQVNNWVIRYNTFEVPPNFGSTPGTGDDNGSALFYGNLGADGACGAPEWTYSYNVGETCGGVGEVRVARATNDRRNPNQAPFYVDAPKGDFRLRARVAAVNRGHPNAFPGADAAGVPRPVGSAPDAGAYERVTGATTGVLSLGTAFSSGSRLSIVRRYVQRNPTAVVVPLAGRPRVAGARTVAAARRVHRIGGAEVLVVPNRGATASDTRWLRRTLARSPRGVRIAVIADAPYACATRAAAAVRAAWSPLFERHRVALVLSGSGRAYERFAQRGVTYVVHGTGASLRACGASAPPRAAANTAPTFVYVTVDAGGVLARVVDVRGRTIDRFRVSPR